MTPRQRVLASIEHREPDRVPVDLGATPSSGISAIAYGGLKRQLYGSVADLVLRHAPCPVMMVRAAT